MSILNLPLVARKEDRTILEANGSILADVWWHDDTPNNKWNADANARAAEVVRRVNLHDELVEALRGLLAIVADSRGVAGYHLNGDVAEWDSFEEVAAAEAAVAMVEAR